MAEGEANGRTWIKVDTEFLLGSGAGDKAGDSKYPRAQIVASYLALIAYSRRRLTDGFLPRAEAPKVISRVLDLTTDDAKLIADDLALIGLLKTDRWGWRIPDYAEWQQTKADVKALTERQSANARRRWEKNASGNASGIPVAMPVASREEKSRYTATDTVGVGEGARARKRSRHGGHGNGSGKIPGDLERLLPAGIKLTTTQAALVTQAWEAGPELRHSLSDVETATNQAAMLVTIAKRVVANQPDRIPKRDHADQHAAATAYATRMRATDPDYTTTDLADEIASTWPDLTRTEIDAILADVTPTEKGSQ